MLSDDMKHWYHNEHLIARMVSKFPHKADQLIASSTAPNRATLEVSKSLEPTLNSSMSALQIQKPVQYSEQIMKLENKDLNDSYYKAQYLYQ